MDFTKEMKRKSVKKSLFGVIFFLLIGLVLLYFSNGLLLLKKPANLYSVPEDELEGKYVTAEIGYIFDGYAETVQRKEGSSIETVISREYVIFVNDESVCGLFLPKNMVEDGDALLEESDDYYFGRTDKINKSITVTGIMEKMPDDSLRYYHQCTDYNSMSPEDQEHVLPLLLKVRSSGDIATTWFMVIAGLVFIVIALVRLIGAMSGKNQKQIKGKAEELSPGNPEYILNQVQELCQSTPAVGGVRMTPNLIYLENGAYQYLYGAKDLCWAYKNTVTHRTNGIKTGTSYNLMLRMADGSMRAMSMNEPQVDEWLQKIFVTFPGCVVGYNKDWEKLFKKDRQALAQIAVAQHAQAASAQTQAEAAPSEAEPQA